MISFSKAKCSCCGFFTLADNIISDICPVCYWQRDFYQEEHIDDNGGPNSVSQRQAKENFKSFGAMEERFKEQVRPPLEGEKSLK